MTVTSTSTHNATESMQMSKSMPTHINLDRWEEAGYVWSGIVTPQELPRVAALVPKAKQTTPINLSIKLAKVGQLLTLDMSFDGDIWVTCQRCLQPLDMDVSHDSELILLQHESQKGLVDETVDDYVWLEEILDPEQETKRGEKMLPICSLVEDELLLDLPLSAKHDDCEMAVAQVGDIVEEEKESPFAALAALKGNLE